MYDGLSLTGQMILWSIVKIIIVLTLLHTIAGYAVLAERKISAWIQDRVGPNRCAPPFPAKSGGTSAAEWPVIRIPSAPPIAGP